MLRNEKEFEGVRDAACVWERVLRVAWVEGGRVDGLSWGVVGIVKRRWVARVDGRRKRSESSEVFGRCILRCFQGNVVDLGAKYSMVEGCKV